MPPLFRHTSIVLLSRTCFVRGTSLDLSKSDSDVLPSHMNTTSRPSVKAAILNVIAELSQLCQYRRQL